MAEVKRTICMGCHCECGVLVTVENGKVTKIIGDPDHPQNEGAICVRGMAYQQLLYHPDRLRYPMERQPNGEWKRISWDEAMDKIVSKFKELMEKYGPESLAFVFCDGDRDNILFNVDWLTAIQSPHLLGTDAQYCIRPNWIADGVTFGQALTWEKGPDYKNSKCILIWGANPLETHLGSKGQEILQAKYNRGAKLIVVDPRFTNLASKADIWLQVRPATDAALALGMLNVIINEELYDKEFVAEWTVGFDKLRERVQEYPPDKVAEITWVPEEKIKEAARMYATNKPASVHHRMGVTMNTNGLQTCRAVDMLIAITGNLDIPGGNLLPFPSPTSKVRSAYVEFPKLYAERLPKEVKQKRYGVKEFPFGYDKANPWNDSHPVLAFDSIPQGGIRGMFIVNDPVMGMQGSKQTAKDLEHLEFLVVMDFWMTPTASFANIVLPAATWLERDLVHELHYPSYVGVAPKVIDPIPECRDEREVSIELRKRLGLKSAYPVESVKEWNDYRLERLGVTFEEFYQKYGTVLKFSFETEKYKKFKKFPGTPSGKVELYSKTLEENGIDPLPHHEEPPVGPVTTPKLMEEYPFIFISGSRKVLYYHGFGRQLPWLREIQPDPEVEINPEAAAKLGIKEGDWVWIETPQAKGERVKFKARLTWGIHPNVVNADSHWWFPERKDDPHRACFESNVNVVVPRYPPYDPVFGCPIIRGAICKITKVEA